MSSDETTIKDAKLVWSDTFNPNLATIDIRNLEWAYKKARYFKDCTFEEFIKILTDKSE